MQVIDKIQNRKTKTIPTNVNVETNGGKKWRMI